MPYTANVFGPQLDNIERSVVEAAKVLVAFFRGDRALRAEQSKNEPIADGFQQGANTGTADTISFPVGLASPGSPFSVFADGQEATAKLYSYIEVLIDDSSGSGRHNGGDSFNPSAGGVGHKIPAGGTVITIPGSENIKRFKMIAETGQTLNYTMQGFV